MSYFSSRIELIHNQTVSTIKVLMAQQVGHWAEDLRRMGFLIQGVW